MGAKVWKRTDQGGSQSYTVGVQQQQQQSTAQSPQKKHPHPHRNPYPYPHPRPHPHPSPQKHKSIRWTPKEGNQNQKEGFLGQKSPKKGFCENFHACQISQKDWEGNLGQKEGGCLNEDLNQANNSSSSSSTTNDGVSGAARKVTEENFNLQSSNNNGNDFNLQKNNCFQSNGKFQFEKNGNYHMGTGDDNHVKSDQFQFNNFQKDAEGQISKFQKFKSNQNGQQHSQSNNNNNNNAFKPRHGIHKKGHKFNIHSQHFKQGQKQQQQQQQFQQPVNPKIQEQKQKFEGAKEEVLKIQERMKQLEDAIRQTKKRKAEQELNDHEEKKQRLRNKLQRSFAKQFEQAAEEGQVKREAEERERQRQEILQLIQKIQKANDPYEILGVDKSVLDLDSKIRTSFKKLAVTLHPDKCSFEDSTEAFRKVRNAYDTLQNKLLS